MNPVPVRLQRKRTKGFKLVSPNGLPIVCVTRPGKWGNPYKAGDKHPIHGWPMSACEAVAMFARSLGDTSGGKRLFQDAKKELRGKNLACYCEIGKPCHADVLLKIANNPPIEVRINTRDEKGKVQPLDGKTVAAVGALMEAAHRIHNHYSKTTQRHNGTNP